MSTMYRVMKKNRSVGHYKFPYGETISARDAGTTDEVMNAYVKGGVLKIIAPEPPPVRDDESVTTGERAEAPVAEEKVADSGTPEEG